MPTSSRVCPDWRFGNMIWTPHCQPNHICRAGTSRHPDGRYGKKEGAPVHRQKWGGILFVTRRLRWWGCCWWWRRRRLVSLLPALLWLRTGGRRKCDPPLIWLLRRFTIQYERAQLRMRTRAMCRNEWTKKPHIYLFCANLSLSLSLSFDCRNIFDLGYTWLSNKK